MKICREFYIFGEFLLIIYLETKIIKIRYNLLFILAYLAMHV